MKLEPKSIAGDLPSLENPPTEPTVDEQRWADSSFDLAQGVKTTEMDLDEPAILPLTADEHEAWARGVADRAAGLQPDACPYAPGTACDLCWLAGFRSATAL